MSIIDDLIPPDHLDFEQLRAIVNEHNRKVPTHENDELISVFMIRQWLKKAGIRLSPNGFYTLGNVTLLVMWVQLRDYVRSLKQVQTLALTHKQNEFKNLSSLIRSDCFPFNRNVNGTIDVSPSDGSHAD